MTVFSKQAKKLKVCVGRKFLPWQKGFDLICYVGFNGKFAL